MSSSSRRLRRVLGQVSGDTCGGLEKGSEWVEVVVDVSNRHVHLSRAHVDALFGEGYALTVHKPVRTTRLGCLGIACR